MMDALDVPTSCVEFISSLHGRQRRLERDISVRDLQTAVKYGIKERQVGGKKAHGPKSASLIMMVFDIKLPTIISSYITDETCTTEVTSWALNQLPLEKTGIDESLRKQIIEQKRRIETGVSVISSHTVIMVDQSSSMNNGDLMGHRSRSRGAYYTIASEMIAQPLMKDLVSFTDVVSIIEMRDDALLNQSVYIEPITWELYNKIVELANNPLSGKGHGNYLPALMKSYEVLNDTDNKNCALLLIFVSDGRPSDASTVYSGIPHSKIHSRIAILCSVKRICEKFKKRLTFGAFGFAHDDGQIFELLKEMTLAVFYFESSGCNAVFSTGLDTQSIRKALYAMSTALSTTRANMSSLAGGSILLCDFKVRRTDLVKDINNQMNDITFNISDYDLYTVEDNLKLWSYAKNWHELDDIEFFKSNLAPPNYFFLKNPADFHF